MKRVQQSLIYFIYDVYHHRYVDPGSIGVSCLLSWHFILGDSARIVHSVLSCNAHHSILKISRYPQAHIWIGEIDIDRDKIQVFYARSVMLLSSPFTSEFRFTCLTHCDEWYPRMFKEWPWMEWFRHTLWDNSYLLAIIKYRKQTLMHCNKWQRFWPAKENVFYF